MTHNVSISLDCESTEVGEGAIITQFTDRAKWLISNIKNTQNT